MFLRQLQNELLKLFCKKRTHIGFVMFVLAQNAMLIAFRFTKWHEAAERMLSRKGHFAADYMSALTVAVIMLIPQIILLMPLYATLVGGDMVAKEAEDGTLRMILCRPVSRLRLLLLKWLAGVMFCGLLVTVLGATALCFARMWFPWGSVFAFAPKIVFSTLDADAGLRCYLWSHGFLVINAVVMFSLAFMFSCFNMKPAAATILALSVLFMNLVMDSIPFFERYHHWLLPYHFRGWLRVFAQPTPWSGICASAGILLGVTLATFVAGAAVFQRRDIKS